MKLKSIFELSMVLNDNHFREIFALAYKNLDYLQDNKYVDSSLAEKGMTIFYRGSQYKKKVRIIVNTDLLVNDVSDSGKIIRKLNKRINSYFNSIYSLDDFCLSGMFISTDIDVETRKNVSAYLKILKRVGKVKGFSPCSYKGLHDKNSFCLRGNSNATELSIYDLEQVLAETDKRLSTYKNIPSVHKRAEGILRVDIRLEKPKAIRTYVDEAYTSDQMVVLLEDCEHIFMGTFTHVIPYGDFYKKDKAEEIVRAAVKNQTMRRKMLRLLALIPEKKSLYLAQKEMNCRNMKTIMKAFAEINLSPVTISKRHDLNHLDNIYFYMIDKK